MSHDVARGCRRGIVVLGEVRRHDEPGRGSARRLVNDVQHDLRQPRMLARAAELILETLAEAGT